ncbi:hypothetical protein F5Y19DRAFT_439659 [Xylariaceae sp. FL1651]|nr:hypothetical protein F5Y19DRAFT_439659 [Xylariaceae sp. FL1651]
MTEDLKSAFGKRQRRRSAKSCEPCRTRKVKCDRGLPCKPCLRSRASLLCTYKSEHIPTPSRSPDRTLSPHTDLTREAGALASITEESQSGDTRDTVDFRPASHAHERATTSLSDRISTLERIVQTPELYRASEYQPSPELKDLEARLSKIEQHLADPNSGSRLSDKAELRIKLPRPILRAEVEKTRLFGKTHWVHSLDQFKILSQMQSTPYSVIEGAQAETIGPLSEAHSARHRAKMHGTKLLQDPMPALRETIPTRSVCDATIDGYLRTFESIFRILHVPSFMKEYESYWAQIEPVRTGFLMKLTMVITIGGIFLADRSASNEIKSTARNWVYAVQWWLIGPTEREAMSLDGIQVFCLLLLARQASALSGSSAIITEALLKLSFTMGLHLDPRVSSSATSFESELRRRLWITVLELTTITSLNSTLPLAISVEEFQVPLPSNIADSKLSNNDDPSTSQESTKYGDLDCSIQILLAKSLRLRMQIVQELNGTSREAAYQRIIELANTLKAHCREMAAFFQQDGSEEQDVTRMGFHHKFIDSYLRRLILFLHRPFANQARKDHRFFLSRKVCLESGLIIASHTETMNLPSETLDDYSYSCISGSGLFKGALGQDVVLAISLEVVTQLEEEGLSGSDHSHTGAVDPLVLLARASRKPLVRFLKHIREQWKQVILLGRPSLKQYLFVSCILSHIEAMELGHHQKLAMIDTMKRELQESIAILRDSSASGNITKVPSEWSDDISPYAIDTMALFGFDFNTLDSTFTMDMPDWTDTPSTEEVHRLV